MTSSSTITHPFLWTQISTKTCPVQEGVRTHHPNLHRTTGFVAELREDLESELSEGDRNLFKELNLAFLGKTCVFVHRSDEAEYVWKGMVVCVH